MGLFKKKEGVPKIPISASLPPLPSLSPTQQEPTKKDLPGLPSFPSSSKNENLNQEMVKSAVSEISSHGEKEIHEEIPESFPVAEAPKEESMIPQKPSIESSIPEPPKPITPITPVPQESSQHLPVPAPLSSPPTQKSNDPIFVRIDKFQMAQKSFEDIKSKVIEAELVLKKIKDVKSKEEEELKGWTEDIEEIKSRLVEIDSDIFSHL